MSELSLDSVSKRYGGAVALSDVTLDVRDGEFFTLVGPSGCGKTTTLRTIAGFETPTEGTVAFDGSAMGETPPEARSVGVVFQQYALFPHLSVGENVAYGLRFVDRPDPDARVAELLDLVGLDEFRERDPGELSGGQQQRVALAKLVESDEIVTHDQAEALAVSDRVAVFADGAVEQIGTPQEVYREPATRFVAEFVGENNVFDGEVRDGAFRIGEAAVPVAAPDGSATVCVRPDRLTPGAGDYSLTGTVTGAEFLGGSARVELSWQGRDLTVRTDRVPARGESLTVSFDASDVVVVG
ncbi:ABC transporter ATP-binding protein [Halobacteriales archaeon SW_8_65_20]|nr:MAG: ABC transporter ATP-binding protein [Halobacteriales archaeon SW_8_65_20]